MADDRRTNRTLVRRVRTEEFYATMRRLGAERAAAPKIVERVLRETPRDQWKQLTERPELLNCGVADHLAALVTEEVTRNPQYALSLAELGVDVGLAIAETDYPAVMLAQTRAIAWKNRGKVLSALARHHEAIDAFQKAENCIGDRPTLEHDRAIVRLNLAITYLDTERYTEALQLIEFCKNVFRSYSDNNLYVLSAFYDGVALERLHKYREARETYLLLLASSSNIAKSTLAALHQTIGLCSTELGDYEAAETNLRKAVALHQELGQPLDALKGEHGIGMLLMRRGLHEDGITHLRAVRHQYLKASLAEEAGLCGLEIVGALLAQRKARQAEALARTITNEFLAASLSTRAITAVGYLSEAIAARNAKPALAADVRNYVLSLRNSPEREFFHGPPTVAG